MYRFAFHLFTGRYQIGKQIGKGSFGVVHECTNKKTKEKFAAKQINVASDEEAICATENERKIHRLLRHLHPNIVNFYERCYEEYWCYMIFELVPGGDFFTVLSKRTRYCEKDAANYLYQVLDAVEYCHAKNIIHRDLKPRNIMIRTQDNQIKVIDFGLARELTNGAFYWYGSAGTPEYMAPEILHEQAYGKPVDIWSCGALFYNTLSGAHPFEYEDKAELSELITTAPVVFPVNLFAEITNESIALVRAMMNPCQSSRLTASAAKNRLRWLADREEIGDVNLSATIDRLGKW